VTLFTEVVLRDATTGAVTVTRTSGSGWLVAKRYVVVASFVVTILPRDATARVPAAPVGQGPVAKNRFWVQVFSPHHRHHRRRHCRNGDDDPDNDDDNRGAGAAADGGSNREDADGSGRSGLEYEATLVGCDGVVDVAVLYIDPDLPWNRGLPEPAGVPLEWGDSRRTPIGTPAAAVGFTEGLAFRALTPGFVRDNRWVVLSGPPFPVELVMYTAPVLPGGFGTAVVDDRARVIAVAGAGVAVPDLAPSAAQAIFGGTSEYAARPVVDGLIAVHRAWRRMRRASPGCRARGGRLTTVPNVGRYFKVVFDPLGIYLIHVKAYLGLAYAVRYSEDNIGGSTVPPPPTACGVVPVASPSGTCFKTSVGLVITGIDGGPVPCNFTSSSGPSPFLGVLSPGDLLTAIAYPPGSAERGRDLAARADGPSACARPCTCASSCPSSCSAIRGWTKRALGGIAPQVVPADVTFYIAPGTPVALFFRKISENYATERVAVRATKTFPPEFDFVTVPPGI
jgi:S1-C subfamily serine protease